MKSSTILTTLKRLSLLILMFMISAIVATLVSVKSPAHAIGQGKERGVEIETFKDQPVEIIAVKVKGASIEPGRKITGDSDWLKGMTVIVKNVSDKPVVYITVSVTAHYEKDGVRKRTEDGRDRVAEIDVVYGLRPPMPGEPARTYSPVPLMTGQTADLVLSEVNRDELYSLLRREDSSTDVAELTLWVDHVAWYGDDDNMWIHGRMLRRDPNNPRTWLPINKPARSLA